MQRALVKHVMGFQEQGLWHGCASVFLVAAELRIEGIMTAVMMSRCRQVVAMGSSSPRSKQSPLFERMEKPGKNLHRYVGTLKTVCDMSATRPLPLEGVLVCVRDKTSRESGVELSL